VETQEQDRRKSAPPAYFDLTVVTGYIDFFLLLLAAIIFSVAVALY
jgi:hypothetical protein